MAKKIAIVTFRFMNFGTVLQAFGLQEALKRIGASDVEILDFPNDSGGRGKQAFYSIWLEQTKEYGLLRGTIRTINELVFTIRTILDSRRDHVKEVSIRTNYYREFEKKFLHLSNPLTCEQLRDPLYVETLPYCCYIAGSDQIWNEKYTKAIDIFFLKYMPKTARCMSYAASFGRTTLDEKTKSEYRVLINNINPILVREQGAKAIADEISGRESFVVPDPTLLHDSNFWVQFSEKPDCIKNKDYILVYSLNSDFLIYKEAIRLGEKYGKKVIAIKRRFNPPYHKNIEWIYAIGPQHFLWLINNASMVITNSFHAEVFSLIFNKPCYPFLDRAEEINERLTSLLNIVEHGHVVTYIGQGHIEPESISYSFDRINSLLMDFRNQAYDKHLIPIIGSINKMD